MTLRQLEVFLAVAREKSFSRAAKRIHSSQPTLSEHISELEGELGKKLFFRRGREVTMTEAGRVFEQYAAGAVSAVEGARQALGDLDGLAHGSLLIGASTTPGLYVMPGIVAAFRTRYPGVELKLQIANSQVIEGRVKERELDLGIVGGHTVGRGEECLAAGLLDELVLVVPSGHRWAKRRDIAPLRPPMPGRDNEDQRSEEHTSELQSQSNLVCRLLLEKKKKLKNVTRTQQI